MDRKKRARSKPEKPARPRARSDSIEGAGGSLRYPRLRDLMALIHMMQGSAGGISLGDIQSRFEVSRRTAERMRDAVLDAFIQVEEVRLDDGTKRWRLKERVLMPATGVGSDDLAALETIGKLLERDMNGDLLASLRRVGDTVRASIRWNDLLRAEPDIEAIAEAEGIASRPGPREVVKPGIISSLREAIKGCSVIRLTHWTATASRPSRGHEVEPLGLLYAIGRRYLVGRSRHHGDIHLFRLARIEDVEITSKPFARPRGFSISDYARQSFGVFQEKPMEVVWRFSPDAARDARRFLFHPTQKFSEQEDGSLLVTFKAGGMLEMCWHLFTWGEAVEVLRPKKLRVMYRQLLASAQAGEA